jgi:hypothetical protein
VIDRPAPEPFADREVPPPVGALAALDEQLDLAQVPLSPGAILYKVSSRWPLRSDVTSLDLPANGAPTAAAQLRLPPTRPPAVLGRGPGTSFTGPVAGGHEIAQSVTADSGWTLRVGGRTARRTRLFGWGQQFRAPAGGTATLSWSTPLESHVLQLVQVVALLGLLVLAGRRRPLAGSGRRRIVRRGPPLVVVGDEAGATATDRGPATGDTGDTGGDSPGATTDVSPGAPAQEVPPAATVTRRRRRGPGAEGRS